MTEEKTPKVSIVCAWYNRSSYLNETIDSLLNQSYEDYEVILINDGSSDKKVKEILDTYNNPKLRVYHQENMGFVKTIKKAIDISKGEFIAIQGSADISHYERIEKQANVLKSREDVVAVGCLVRNIVSSEKTDVFGIPIDGNMSKEGLKRVFMLHGEVMFRRSAYLQAGGYRELFKYSQDRDLWLRLSLLGNIVVLPEVLYERYVNIGGVSGDAEKQFLQRCLGHFAVHCHYERLNNGVDPLDADGEYSMIYWKTPFKLQVGLVKLALFYFYSNKENWQYIFHKASKMRFGFLAKAIGGLCFWSPLTAKFLIKNIFRK